MRNKKNSIIKEGQATSTEDLFFPSPKEEEVVKSVFHKFRLSADSRNRSFAYFDDANLIEYIEDSVRRFVTNVDEREDIEDWQARIHNPFTRNKVLAILGKVVQVLPIAQFSGRGEEDYRKGMILTNLYEYAEEVDDYDELMIHMILECIVKGTAIGYEGLERKEKLIKNVYKCDDDLQYKTVKETTSRLFGAIVPLEDFYPSHVSARNIKQMPYCFWRSVLPYEKFQMDFDMYSKSLKVKPKTANTGAAVQQPYYVPFISDDVQEGSVEIIRYYNKDVDEYVVLANGIWLNPIEMKEKNEISPIPFNHKELPFWDIRYDLFGSDFFYGKSLPDRLKALQDVLNVLNNMLLDQSFLTIFPPLLTNGVDSIEDDYLRPGRRTPIDTQGNPMADSFMKLDLGTPNGWHQYILEYTQKTMESASLDQVSGGQAGVGGRTTAQEIRLAADGVSSMLGLFARLVNYGVKRKAQLKAANILQFWTDPYSPMISRINGEDGAEEFNKVFNTFKIDGAVMSTGKRGSKVIEMYKTPEEMPTRADVKARSDIFKIETGKPIEIIALDPSYIRNFMYDIKLAANPKSETTKDIEKAMQLEKVKIYMSFFPSIVNVNELAAQTAEKMGDDPTKILKDEVFVPPQDNKQKVPPMGTETQDASGNAVQSMQGGQEGAMGMRDLQNQMIG